MAVLTINSEQYDNTRKLVVDHYSKLRFSHFKLPAITVAGDANSLLNLCKLPAGRTRVLPWLSRLWTSAFGASRTIDIGHLAYIGSDGITEVVASVDAFADGLDVSSATANLVFSSAIPKFDIYAKGDVIVQAKVLGGTIPIGATFEGCIAYERE